MIQITKMWWACLAISLLFAGYFFFQGSKWSGEPLRLPEKKAYSTDVVKPIPSSRIDNQEKVLLGFTLFNDPNFSSNQQVSCASCHHLETNGAEKLRVSHGVNGFGLRNSPTVFNVSLNTRFFWDGRASSLEHQIDGPIHNPLEMNTNWATVVEEVKRSKDYKALFSSTYDGEITEQTIKDALVIFMSSLNTPDAPFDKFLMGDDSALSAAAKRGWFNFQKLGCIACHQGQNLGGNLFQRFGNLQSILPDEQVTDLGRYNLTGNNEDKYVFRVPGLRNVATTPPYFHDGHAATLEEAIAIMARVQLGMELDAVTTLELSAFLNSLTAPKPPILRELMNENQ
ncbi:cytochrome c551 peroxidase [Vibrio nigripulchritudo ATCC 27043]|uniref:Cytochrome c peroxidase n=1 Tax=Vibrio nigripulchritudo SOn1 TaxID=1238450 RepID=A0AAV2VKA6_9VIBR|nr:cytochrome c peroxidase [Vibrio nigripulchritudo]EGU60283.1 cytochrome c551 peroxidase [Vibrio nigripulchritudo ATCC 27043]CCO44869.1 putative cytochrome c peroxidase [Vibrio nigripulchritudo SOn1]